MVNVVTLGADMLTVIMLTADCHYIEYCWTDSLHPECY
jgi:hypothetical protein